MNLERNEERILVKYIDSNYITYKCVISESDVFVVNFCKKNLEKMERILLQGNVVEMDNHYLLKVDEPVCLEYILEKEQQDDNKICYIVEKIKSIEKENIFFKKNISDIEKKINNIIETCEIIPSFINNSLIDMKILKNSRKYYEIENIRLEKKLEIIESQIQSISELRNENSELKERIKNIEQQINCGVFLPGYLGGIIPINISALFLSYEKISVVNPSIKSNFYGDSIENLKYLQNLKILTLSGFYNTCSWDFSYLKNIEKLEMINFTFSRGTPLDFIISQKTLIELENVFTQIDQTTIKRILF